MTTSIKTMVAAIVVMLAVLLSATAALAGSNDWVPVPRPPVPQRGHCLVNPSRMPSGLEMLWVYAEARNMHGTLMPKTGFGLTAYKKMGDSHGLDQGVVGSGCDLALFYKQGHVPKWVCLGFYSPPFWMPKDQVCQAPTRWAGNAWKLSFRAFYSLNK